MLGGTHAIRLGLSVGLLFDQISTVCGFMLLLEWPRWGSAALGLVAATGTALVAFAAFAIRFEVS